MNAKAEPDEAVLLDVNWLAIERYEAILAELLERLEIEQRYRDTVAIETAIAKAVTGGVNIGMAEVVYVIGQHAKEQGSDLCVNLQHHGEPVDRWAQEFGEDEIV